MLTNPSTSALRSLYSISKRESWPEVSKMLEDELAKTHEMLVGASGETTLYRLQGRAQFITEFLATVRDARDQLEKRNESTL